MATLQGAHRVAPCEACHDVSKVFGTDVLTCDGVQVLPATAPPATPPTEDTGPVTPEPWTYQCLTCHECNRPQEGDSVCGEPVTGGPHYDGQSCGDAGCHAFRHEAWNAPGAEGVLFCDGGGGGCRTCHDEELGTLHASNGAPLSPSHDAHLTTEIDGLPDAVGVYSPGLDCDACHPDGGRNAPTHENAAIDVALTSGATTWGTFDPITKSCAVVCHGNGPNPSLTYSLPVTVVPGAPDVAILPVWDDTGLGGGCDTCHGSPPVIRGDDVVSLYHAVNVVTQCNVCHEPTGELDPNIIPSTGYGSHGDGVFQCTNGGICP